MQIDNKGSKSFLFNGQRTGMEKGITVMTKKVSGAQPHK